MVKKTSNTGKIILVGLLGVGAYLMLTGQTTSQAFGGIGDYFGSFGETGGETKKEAAAEDTGGALSVNIAAPDFPSFAGASVYSPTETKKQATVSSSGGVMRDLPSVVKLTSPQVYMQSELKKVQAAEAKKAEVTKVATTGIFTPVTVSKQVIPVLDIGATTKKAIYGGK